MRGKRVANADAPIARENRTPHVSKRRIVGHYMVEGSGFRVFGNSASGERRGRSRAVSSSGREGSDGPVEGLTPNPGGRVEHIRKQRTKPMFMGI